jgi:colicin import membrane protein
MKTSFSLHWSHPLSESPGIGGMVVLSIFLHLTGIAFFFSLPNLASTRTFYAPVYSVRLVSLQPSPPPAPAPSVASPKAIEPKAKEVEPVKPPVKVEEKPKPAPKPKVVSLAPPKKKETIKKKEEPEKKITEAMKHLRERRQKEKVEDAIDRIRRRQAEKKIESAVDEVRRQREARLVDSAIEGIRKRVTIGAQGAIESGDPSTGGASSGVMSIKHKLYYNLIWQRIRSVWMLPTEALRGQKNLETIIAIRIGRDGEIEDIQFEKKSGNPYLDESALRAIKKANPLPPLPPGFEGNRFDVGVRFTPSDL